MSAPDLPELMEAWEDFANAQHAYRSACLASRQRSAFLVTRLYAAEDEPDPDSPGPRASRKPRLTVGAVTARVDGDIEYLRRLQAQHNAEHAMRLAAGRLECARLITGATGVSDPS